MRNAEPKLPPSDAEISSRLRSLDFRDLLNTELILMDISKLEFGLKVCHIIKYE